MTLQTAPRTAGLAQLLDQIDTAVAETKPLTPTRHSENHRNAITACVDGLVTNQSDKIDALRRALDAVQQRALESAAKAKRALEDHVIVTDRLDDGIRHIQDLVADLAEQFHEVGS